jgi:phenylacetic acid degradation operon negative regulatory protein
LLSVLGEFVFPTGKAVWTASLIRVLMDVGFERDAARQAVARCAKAGWLEGERHGRDVRWSLTPAGIALVDNGIKRVEDLAREPDVWDGRWLALFITIPQHQRVVRAPLYRSLSWDGCGNPAPGVWLTAHADRRDRITELVARFGLQDTTLSFVGPSTAIGLSDDEIVKRAWNLETLADEYARLVAAFASRRPRSGPAALSTLLELDELLQRLPYLDPLLPAALAPKWQGRRDAKFLLERRAAWLSPAREHWLEIVRATERKPS